MGIQRFLMTQPDTDRPVYEFGVTGRFANWMHSKGWGAVTLPMPFFSIILYWLGTGVKEPGPYLRVHEFTHIAQKDRPGPFYFQYFKAMFWHHKLDYKRNRMEMEARAAVAYARRYGLPEWAR